MAVLVSLPGATYKIRRLARMPEAHAGCAAQVVWTGGARSILLWCAYTGAYVGALINREVEPLPDLGRAGPPQ